MQGDWVSLRAGSVKKCSSVGCHLFSSYRIPLLSHSAKQHITEVGFIGLQWHFRVTSAQRSQKREKSSELRSSHGCSPYWARIWSELDCLLPQTRVATILYLCICHHNVVCDPGVKLSSNEIPRAHIIVDYRNAAPQWRNVKDPNHTRARMLTCSFMVAYTRMRSRSFMHVFIHYFEPFTQ